MQIVQWLTYQSGVFSLPFANFSSMSLKIAIIVGWAEEETQVHVQVSIICPHILRKALLYYVFWKIMGLSQI